MLAATWVASRQHSRSNKVEQDVSCISRGEHCFFRTKASTSLVALGQKLIKWVGIISDLHLTCYPINPTKESKRYIVFAASVGTFLFRLRSTASNTKKRKQLVAAAAMSNPVVFFDVTAGGSPVGRIEMTVSAAVQCKLPSTLNKVRLGYSPAAAEG